MSTHNFTVDFKSLKLSAEQTKALLDSVNKAVSSKINEIAAGTVTVSVLFQLGAGFITATQKRAGKKIATAQLQQSGTISLAVGQTNDLIIIDGSCQGSASLTISVATERATPVSFKSGLISEIFSVK